ncbi:regulatory protein [Mesonia hippocampi]|uniref:Regulatory protein RecX n=1 Tax=Mesonia hippocampi TaxID=1628250 RepID=A0A840EQI0_9FLAO|nr:regulatory protein RecX [Mesonia hippocampi]MBB4119301.1 regulatory protein [Mesonia hippocampi]
MSTYKTYTVEEATAKLMRYCAYQERCHKEVTQKLTEMRMTPLAQEHIITKLISDNFLNETRFAKAFARGKFRIKKWGRLRILRELKLREVSSYNIKEALKEFTENEYLENFHQLADQKIQQVKHLPYLKQKQKLMDYLVYRGYEKPLIYEKLQELDYKK